MAVSSSPTRAAEKPGAAVDNQAAAPRKRRRRAPTTGAAEDCFACRKRQTKCDRKRPYCSQCIELGKECSGYRTTLTWGVGVASRGKLRGLSLPVAKSPSAATSNNRESKAQGSATGNASSGSGQAASTGAARSRADSHPLSTSTIISSVQAPHEFMNYDATNPIPIPSPAAHLPWHVPGFGEHMEGYHGASGKPTRARLHSRPLQRLHTSLAASYEDNGLSASTGSMSAYSDSDYPSPGDYPNTPDDFPFMEPSIPPYHNNNLYMHDSTPLSSSENLAFHSMPRSYPAVNDDMCSSISSDHSNQDFGEVRSIRSSSFGAASLPETVYSAEMSSSAPLQYPGYAYCQRLEDLPEENVSSSDMVAVSPHMVNNMASSIPRSVYTSTSVHLSPRMSYLLNYYDRYICPVLVAFDGPTNPYRMHVLHLAMHSEGLQNAIAALSTNNIRMRGGTETRRLGFEQGQQIEVTPEELRDLQGEPTPEEQRYKQASIAMLNAQLADPTRAKDDSVLATLLILCLFHVCDSGFSKFKTQLAGVQKLLSMRDRSVQSNFVGWIEMFFTWFDVMTSTVNDREAQVRGDSLDMLNLSANLGALEHLAGCEGRLFKLIARLGRLNLLSQNRPVREQPDGTPRPSPLSRKARDYYSLHYDQLDGNGWGTPISGTPTSPSPAAPSPCPEHEDGRQEFWAEWHDIRSRLQEWELDQPSPSSPNSMPSPSTDLLHISESFRYSALLYTERLAYPNLPPASANFQSLVSRALYHISHIAVDSCVNKFLLWPLFITGTECVEQAHRALIRQRCVEIQRESGFWNNLSGLEVLERVWREDDVDVPALLGVGDAERGMGKQAFRWRKAMNKVDGEYIVI